MRMAPLTAAALAIATAIMIAVIWLGMRILRWRNSSNTALPPQLACAVAGLLSGLSLEVLLPDAIEQLTPRHSARLALGCFFGGLVAMYFFRHVICDHQCNHHHSPLPATHRGPPPTDPWWKQNKQRSCTDHECACVSTISSLDSGSVCQSANGGLS